MLLGAKAGDVIWYYKTDGDDKKKKAGVSINPQEIGVCKYKEMLISTVKDALEILGYDNAEQIFNNNIGITRRGDKRTGKILESLSPHDPNPQR